MTPVTHARALRQAVMTVAIVAATAVSASAQCSISSVEPLSFGTYDTFSPTPLDSMGRLTVQCGRAVWLQVTISHGGGNPNNPRVLRGGGGQLLYDVYLDAARTIVWGEGTRGTQAYQGLNTLFSLPIFGRIPAGQDAKVGAYSDRLTVRIDF